MNPQQRLYLWFMGFSATLTLLIITINQAVTGNHWVADIIIWTFFATITLVTPKWSEIEEYRREKYGKS